MPVRVEVLRSLNQWVGVDFGSLPIIIKSNISSAETKYIVAEDEDEVDPLLYKFAPVSNSDLSKAVVSTSGVLYDISVDPIKKDNPIIIEGIVPGSTKPDLLRIIQE